MASSFRKGSLTKITLLIVTTILLLPISNVRGEHDFDSATNLESGVTHEGIIDDTDRYFKIEVPIGDIIKFEFNDLDDQWLDFCVYDGNTSSDQVDCVGGGFYSVSFNEKATSNAYFVKISCSECNGNVEEARYSLSATLIEDEAGDSIQSATYLSPESMVYGTIHGSESDYYSNEWSESDFYSTPVMNGDSIRLVITDQGPYALTSYILYDNYGIKIAEEEDSADYDFTVVAENDGNLTVELYCWEGSNHNCDYSLIAIGSTYLDSSAQDSEVTENQSSGDALNPAIGVIVGLLIIVMLVLRNRREVTSSVQPIVQNTDANDQIQELQQTVTQAEIEKTQIQDELDKAKSTTVVQNITYNIQDSAIAGDINATGLKENDD